MFFRLSNGVYAPGLYPRAARRARDRAVSTHRRQPRRGYTNRKRLIQAPLPVVCAMPHKPVEVFDGGATALYPDSYGCYFLFMFCTSIEAGPESEPGSQAWHLLLNVSPLPRCSPPLPRCCRRRFLQRMTHHRANGAMVRPYGLLATKPAALAAAMSLRDTMGPVRDTVRMLQFSDSTLQKVLRARSRGWGWPGQVTEGWSKCRHHYRILRSGARP